MQYDNKAINRLKRIEGQLRGVLRMMEDGKDCKDVITQLSAIRSGVDRTIGVIVTENLVECLRENDGNDEKMNEGNIMTEYEERFSSMGNPIYKYIIER